MSEENSDSHWQIRKITTWILSAFVGYDTGPKKLRMKEGKNYMVKQNVLRGIFRHAEFKSGPLFCANPAPSKVFGYFLVQNTWPFLLVFRKTTSFRVKLGSQIFRNIRPCPQTLRVKMCGKSHRNEWHFFKSGWQICKVCDNEWMSDKPTSVQSQNE